MGDEAAGATVDGVAAGLSLPFAGCERGLDLLTRQPLETKPRLDNAVPDLALLA